MDKIEEKRKPISYSGGFFMLIAFCVGGLILTGVLGMVIWKAVSGQNFEELQTEITNPSSLRQLQLINILATVVSFFVATIITASFLNKKPFSLIGFDRRATLRQVLLTILIIACGMALSASLGYLSYQLPLPEAIKVKFDQWESDYMSQAAALINLKTIPELIISIIVLALVPAIVEETFFRGGLQNFLYRSNKKLWISVITVSIIFSVIHVSGYGFLSRMMLGLILGLIYYYTGNIWLSMLAHFINNAVSVILLYSEMKHGGTIEQMMSDKTGNYWGFIVVPVIVFLLIRLKQQSTHKNRFLNGV